MLCLPIKFSDKCETYEIKRTFKVRKTSTFHSPLDLCGSDEIGNPTAEEPTNSIFTVSKGCMDRGTSIDSSTTVATIVEPLSPEPLLPEPLVVNPQSVDPPLTVNQSSTIGYQTDVPPTEQSQNTKYQKSDIKQNGESYSQCEKKRFRSSLYSKAKVQITRSTPLATSQKWIARGKVHRASTTDRHKKPCDGDVERQFVGDDSTTDSDDEDYIAITVTRIIQDISDSDEEMDVRRRWRASRNNQITKLLANHENHSSIDEIDNTIQQEDSNITDQEAFKSKSNITRFTRKIKSYRKHSIKNSPSINSLENGDAKVSKQASQRHRHSSIRPAETSKITDNSTLEGILSNREIVKTISNSSSSFNFQLETDKLNFEVKTKKPDTIKTNLARRYSRHRRYASTKKYRRPINSGVERAKSFSSPSSSPRILDV